jgi:hypothetical protein
MEGGSFFPGRWDTAYLQRPFCVSDRVNRTEEVQAPCSIDPDVRCDGQEKGIRFDFGLGAADFVYVIWWIMIKILFLLNGID